MSVSMLVEDLKTGESDDIPVCTNSKFVRYWKRAAEEERLELVGLFGALEVRPDDVRQLADELARLRAWASRLPAEDEYAPVMLERIDTVARVLASKPPGRYEISI